MTLTLPENNKNQEIFFQSLEFIASYPNIKVMPKAFGDEVEIAFIGRSNSGKSTLLNSLCGQSHLAKSGKTPGLTRAINVFANKNEIFINKYIIDLPGYGYAKMPHTLALDVANNLANYLQKRVCLKAVVILIDSRRLIKESDWEVINVLPDNLALTIAFSKVDKLSTNELNNSKQELEKQVGNFSKKQPKKFSEINIFPVSSFKTSRLGNIGLNQLKSWLFNKFFEEIKL